jgi:hypothetical protein
MGAAAAAHNAHMLDVSPTSPPLRTKRVRTFETSGKASSLTQVHNPDDQNPQTHSYKLQPVILKSVPPFATALRYCFLPAQLPSVANRKQLTIGVGGSCRSLFGSMVEHVFWGELL